MSGTTIVRALQAATGSLPPIVSLDKFMSSTDSESPSESDIEKRPLVSDNNGAEAVIVLMSPKEKANTDLGERLWEGPLHLSVSSMISVIILKSGEKTTTKEWPMLLEIKGRVR
ncbi:SPOC domain / Transcription elongation factor S-II protein [Raphanus sativus]|uniref:Uncharacterized protein LOC108808593 n=1 Tax=Raphanus sativus TaxID=3726 RepID=A0A9W3DNM8_RAPSA|nr:uncharacterized protein LOC108808593 [Raphanus sativus]KAJ4905238.1 SPOC domain / Transcription elongation factor S-II protein [Raphanus sativus]